LLHRIRNCFNIPSEPLNNEVELDETFIGGKMENGQGGKGKMIVFGMKERGGNFIGKVVENRKSETLTPHITQNVNPNSDIITDELLSYKSLRKWYNHFSVNHRQKEYVRGNVHTNNLESFWSILKRGYVGIYHWMSGKHLFRYVNEFGFRHNTKNHTGEDRFNYFFDNFTQRLRYRELISC